jgi:hypothetical protein
MNSIENKTQSAVRMDEIVRQKQRFIALLLLKVMIEERKKRKRLRQGLKRIRKNLLETRLRDHF